MKNPECDFCNHVSGVCVECDACFGEHCECNPCQHGKPRDIECVFCGRILEHPGILLTEDPDENQDYIERDAEENS
jgi:hypothetical protein